MSQVKWPIGMASRFDRLGVPSLSSWRVFLRRYFGVVFLSAILGITCLAIYPELEGDAAFLSWVLTLAMFGCGHAVFLAAVVASAIADPASFGDSAAWNWAFWVALSPSSLALAVAALCTLPRLPREGIALLLLLACNVTAGDMITHSQVVLAAP